MSENDNVILGCFGVLVGLLLVLVLDFIVGGVATMVLWNWFATSLFDVPNISIAQAIGLQLLVNSIVSKPIPKKQEEGETVELYAKAAAIAISRPLLAIGIGWIALQFL